MKSSEFVFPVDAFDLKCIVKGYSDKRGLIYNSFKVIFQVMIGLDLLLKRYKDLTVRFSSNVKSKITYHLRISRIMTKSILMMI